MVGSFSLRTQFYKDVFLCFFKYFEWVFLFFFTVLHEKHTDDTKHQETRAANHRSVSPDCFHAG